MAPLRIGLSANLIHADPQRPLFKGKTLKFVEQQLSHWIMTEGALAYMVPLPPSDGQLALEAYVQDLDALVLQGGADVSPASYGELPMRPEWSGDQVRDEYEMALIRMFLQVGKPVLGVCRGLQILNVAMGGSLYQDINTQLEGSRVHRDWEIYDQNFHNIRIVRPSHLAKLYPTTAIGRVCSVHHQAIKALGKGLVVEASSVEDNVVEAVRLTGPTWVYGVQWHPEWHDVNDTSLMDSRPLLRDFLAAAAQRKAARAGTKAHT
ncbi:MAG: gamma-glutamyl-gamma-aminobutyrate hydrolase family protein [Deltaproteobacteria bacterium]|nr:gamma-glutamyl-gamma-aminobutyrate hydrolase family protein [Deltaproteobacteria bacterium]